MECGGHLVVKASRQNDVLRCGVPLQVADPARVAVEVDPPLGQRGDEPVLGDLPQLHLHAARGSCL